MNAYWKYIPLLLSLAVVGCSTPEHYKQERFEKAKLGTGDVVMGVVWPESRLVSDFKAGVEMSLHDVNKQGLYNGRRLKLIFRDNHGNAKLNRKMAREFARNTDMVAVFGHFYSDMALPASVTYEENGLLFLTPSALLYDLGLHGFKMFFRSIPNTVQIGQKCAEYTYQLGYNKPVIIWVRSLYGKSLFEIYKSHLGKLGIDAAYSFSFFPWQKDYRDIISQMKNLNFDLVFIAVSLPDAAYFIRDSRRHGITQPFFGVNFLADQIVKNTGGFTNDIYTVANFNPDSESPKTQEFVRRFKEQYGHIPDVWGAYGYDGIQMLADLVRKYETSNPQILASNLRYLENWEGVTGLHTFTPRGEVLSKPLYLERFENNVFNVIDVDTLSEVSIYQAFNYIFRDRIERGYVGLVQQGKMSTLLLPEYVIFSGLGEKRISAIADTILREVAHEMENRKDYKMYIEFYSDDVFVSGNGSSAQIDSMLSLNISKSVQVSKYMYSLGFDRARLRLIGRGYSKSRGAADEFANRQSFKNRLELTFVPQELWAFGAGPAELPDQVEKSEPSEESGQP